ncbi:MAG: hypothetical protein QME63_01080 [Actinomycetota bacterium]|nr:hypothetical protein [Actinomycetota bacterium]
MTAANLLAIIVTVVGIAAALIARKTWLLVEDDLADSWRWILPSVPVYAISFAILVVHNLLQKYAVPQPVFSLAFSVSLIKKQAMLTIKIWEPIILVLKNIQVLVELLFLILVLIGLIRQYRLFQELYRKQGRG